MNAETRRAIVWREIERKAFRPVDRGSWLRVYEMSLAGLWGVQHPDVCTRQGAGFDACFVNIVCDYKVENPDKYDVTIVNVASNAQACWHLHIDSGFCSKGSLYKCPTDNDYPREYMDHNLEKDVTYVLDGMIFHPRGHAHGDKLGIVSHLNLAPPALSPSEIRIGGGIENAFAFLTHLRYQFCLLSEDARQAERTRLIRLFTTAIQERLEAVQSTLLFGFRA